MKQMHVATANPLHDTVCVAVGGVRIETGFSVHEGPDVQRLSQAVLQLAVVNMFVAVTLRVIALIIALVYSLYSEVVTVCINIVFSVIIMRLGVRGVKTRNRPMCPLCCGYLTAFYITYIILAVMEAISVVVALVDGFVFLTLIDFFFLVLYCVTAEQSRRLLDVLALLPDRDGPESFDISVGVLEATHIDVITPASPKPLTRAVV